MKRITLLISFCLIVQIGFTQVFTAGAAGFTSNGDMTQDIQMGWILPGTNAVIQVGWTDNSYNGKFGLHWPFGKIDAAQGMCEAVDKRWYIEPTFGLGQFKDTSNAAYLGLKTPENRLMGIGSIEIGKKFNNYMAPYISVNYQNNLFMVFVGVKVFSF